MWEIRQVARSGTSSETWDAPLLPFAASANSASTTQDNISNATWTSSIASLDWNSSDTVLFEVCRNANHPDDDLVGDANMIDFSIEIPLE
jgi:hypothetical protein